jgi:branched-chain amino acid transport system ATP-binding protein
MLEVAALDAWYGQAQILYGVGLRVAAGECVALVGRNGAGKSTTMKAIMGLLAKKRGRVAFRGRDISAWPAYRIGRLGLGWVPEDRRIFTDLTVRENLAVARQPAREDAPEWTPEKLYALFPNLGAMPDRPGGRMSGGEQQMLTVARTLMGNPYLVLLDEPSEGVAPLIVEVHPVVRAEPAFRAARVRSRRRAREGRSEVRGHDARSDARRGTVAQPPERLRPPWGFPTTTHHSQARCPRSTRR